MIVPGDTFLVPSGKEGKHLFFVAVSGIVLCDYGTAPQAILVNATTLYENAPFDNACIIEAGEHPFIRQKSVIAYRYARIEPVAQIAGKGWTPRERCSPALLDRILAGFHTSRLVPKYIQQILEAYAHPSPRKDFTS